MGRAPCCDKTNVKRGPWSPEEDAILKNYLQAHGTGGNWIALPHKAGLKRCGKSCRLRWLNYLRPDIKHGGFTEEEDNIICALYSQLGSRWSIIASQLSGRTDNDIKNYWNTKLKKKMSLAGTSIPANNVSNEYSNGKFDIAPVDNDYFSSTTTLPIAPSMLPSYVNNDNIVTLMSTLGDYGPIMVNIVEPSFIVQNPCHYSFPDHEFGSSSANTSTSMDHEVSTNISDSHSLAKTEIDHNKYMSFESSVPSNSAQDVGILANSGFTYNDAGNENLYLDKASEVASSNYNFPSLADCGYVDGDGKPQELNQCVIYEC